MIDLHCHLLPGVDDGAPDHETSVAMARAALADGIDTIVATPHVSERFRTDPRSIAERVAEVQRTLDEQGVGVRVVPGAEVALTLVSDLGPDDLRACCIGETPYLLLEPAFSSPMPFLAELVYRLSLDGLRPLVVHPERSLDLQRDAGRVEELVAQGVGLVVNAGSVAGGFGGRAHRFAWELLDRGLVHALASDAHDAGARAPLLAGPLADEPIGTEALELLTQRAPAAIVAGEALPDPVRVPRPRRRWRILGG